MTIDPPLRILYVSRQFYPVQNGAENQMLRLAAEMRRRGHDVQALSARFQAKWPREETLPGQVPLRRLPSPGVRGAGTLCFLLALARYLVAHRHRFDLIHVNSLKYAAAMAALVGPRVGLPVVGRSVCAGEDGDMAHLKSLPAPKMLLRCLHRLDRVVALSRDIQDELIENRFDSDRIVVIPNGVDPDQFSLPDANQRAAGRALFPPTLRDRLIAVSTARLVRQKGIEFAIRALAEPNLRGKWGLVIVGEGEERPALERLAREMGLAEAVFFAGRQDDVRPFLHGADAFCLPSLCEGLSNSLLEAMATGLPVVATRISGSTDVLRDGIDGVLVPAADPAALARGLQTLEVRETRLACARESRQRILDCFTIAHCAERHEKVYADLIREKNGRGSGKQGSKT